MFAAEKEVRRWREEVERRSSLSPREIDELEDHLRARVELEMELEPALGPARALAIARGELVRAVDLSREFARAGKSTWRRWMAAGWAMAARSEVMKLNVTSPSLFGVSFALPAIWWPLPSIPGGEWSYGYEVFFLDLFTDGGFLLLLPSVAVILSVRAFPSRSPGTGRWLGRILGVAGSLGVAIGLLAVVRSAGESGPVLGIGAWMWHLSFVLAAIGLRIRNREWASARVEDVIA